MKIEVKGHSGCQIDVVREGKELFVYKSSKDPKYLKRLVLQAEKQIKASEYEYQHIRIPKIHAISNSDGVVSVKMDYVYSKNFIEYFESAGFEQISYLIKALKIFLDKEIKDSKISILDPSVLHEKFFDVTQKVQSNPFLQGDSIIKELLERSKAIFDTDMEIVLPMGTCHGDLTFSNILFNGNNYYLIDFLDSFVESPLLDIIKLRQDTRYLWSQLMYVRDYDRIRLEIISSKIDYEIDTYYSSYDWYKNNYRIFQLMNFWRIVQYAHDEKVITYLKDVIKSLLNEF